MSFAQDIKIPQDTLEDVIFPPGDLPSDEPPLETDLHRLQMTLLIQCLEGNPHRELMTVKEDISSSRTKLHWCKVTCSDY